MSDEPGDAIVVRYRRYCACLRELLAEVAEHDRAEAFAAVGAAPAGDTAFGTAAPGEEP